MLLFGCITTTPKRGALRVPLTMWLHSKIKTSIQTPPSLNAFTCSSLHSPLSLSYPHTAHHLVYVYMHVSLDFPNLDQTKSPSYITLDPCIFARVLNLAWSVSNFVFAFFGYKIWDADGYFFCLDFC